MGKPPSEPGKVGPFADGAICQIQPEIENRTNFSDLRDTKSSQSSPSLSSGVSA